MFILFYQIYLRGNCFLVEMVAASKRKDEKRRAKFNQSRQIGNNRRWMEHERRGSHSLSFPCGSIHLGFQVKKKKIEIWIMFGLC